LTEQAKRALPRRFGNALFEFQAMKLDHRDINGPRPFLPFFYFKGNPVTFVQGFKSWRIDS
jgi:hypothetical protein